MLPNFSADAQMKRERANLTPMRATDLKTSELTIFTRYHSYRVDKPIRADEDLSSALKQASLIVDTRVNGHFTVSSSSVLSLIIEC